MSFNDPADEYEAACVRAATNQGLDPITRAVRDAGVPCVVDQTGGFCMVLTVHAPNNPYKSLGIIRDGPTENDHLVCSHVWTGVDDEEEMIAEHATIEETVAYARYWFIMHGGEVKA